MHHNHKTTGHPGELETYNSMRSQYWWPGLQTFVKNYVKGCVPFVNNLKLTDTPHIQHTSQQKELKLQDHSQTALWI